MAYDSTTDYLALLRLLPGGVRTERMPGLDYIVNALARAGMFQIAIGQTAPVINQSKTAWFKPAMPSWAFEGTLFLWNAVTVEYEPATPALWAAIFSSASSQTVVQDVTSAGPVLVEVNAGIVRVQNVGAAVTLLMPPSATMLGPVLISDWANHAGSHNIQINLSGGDVLPLAATSWTIAADAGSVFLRPVPGGFAL
jgi:hypothetical protein